MATFFIVGVRWIRVAIMQVEGYKMVTLPVEGQVKTAPSQRRPLGVGCVSVIDALRIVLQSGWKVFTEGCLKTRHRASRKEMNGEGNGKERSTVCHMQYLWSRV